MKIFFAINMNSPKCKNMKDEGLFINTNLDILPNDRIAAFGSGCAMRSAMLIFVPFFDGIIVWFMVASGKY